MEPFTVRDIVGATGGRLVAGDEEAALRSISTDSRTLRKGDLFIALRGKNFDGNEFLLEAAAKGSSGLLYSRKISDRDRRAWSGKGLALIAVDDTLRGLQDLAAWYRRRFSLPVIGVTGSNGKTTTKEMIRAGAGSRFRVLCNEGTINNLVGVPLTLLGIERVDTLAVVEMGMNAKGEIGRLAEIAGPEIGVITNVGPAHLEFLGSLENVAAAKEELLEAMASSPGGRERVAVLNADDPRVAGMAGRHDLRVTTFGKSPAADVRALRVDEGERGPRVTIGFRRAGREAVAEIPARGSHNVCNALAAAATCEALGVPPDEIAESLSGVRMPAMRMEISSRGGLVVVNDAYNANPASMREAIKTLAGMETGGKRMLVIGDMLELGEAAAAAHRDVGRCAAERGIDLLVTVGELAAGAAEAGRAAGMPPGAVTECRDADEAAAAVRERGRRGDIVLLKASRRAGLEEIIDKLEG